MSNLDKIIEEDRIFKDYTLEDFLNEPEEKRREIIITLFALESRLVILLGMKEGKVYKG